MVRRAGIGAWIVYAPGPPPEVPGRVNEFRPRHPHAESAVMHTRPSTAAIARLMMTDPSAASDSVALGSSSSRCSAVAAPRLVAADRQARPAREDPAATGPPAAVPRE